MEISSKYYGLKNGTRVPPGSERATESAIAKQSAARGVLGGGSPAMEKVRGGAGWGVTGGHVLERHVCKYDMR